MSRISIHCSACDSVNINRDANAQWNEQTQEWEMTTVFDTFYCEDCGYDVDVIEKELKQEGSA